jgi:hypothetical protein
MNETNSNWLTNNPCSVTTAGITTGTSTIAGGYPGTSINTNLGTVGMGNINPSERLTVSGTNFNQGLTLQGNSTINYSTNQIQNNMAPRQVQVAVFTITRDKKTNEINSTKFVKQLWIEQKNGISIDLLVAKELGNDFDPETTVIKVLTTVSF